MTKKFILLLLLCVCASSALHAANYLTFTAEEDNSMFGIFYNGEINPDVQYSLDGGKTWTALEDRDIVPLQHKGDKALLKGKKTQAYTQDEDNYTYFVMTGRIAASGNIMSLIGGNDKNLTIKGEKCFYRLFIDCTSLTKAPELPATQLNNSCYEEMFRGCSRLKQAPKLPATTLAKNCYKGMFWKCTSLTQAPELPATQLANYCYEEMFWECTSLTQAPQLPATKLTDECYAGMFGGCTSLTKAPELPAQTLTNGCYEEMFKGCSKLAEIKVGFTDWGEIFRFEEEGENNMAAAIVEDKADVPVAVEENEADVPVVIEEDEADVPVAIEEDEADVPVAVEEDEHWSTSNWLENVAPKGKFICPKMLSKEFGENRIPQGWKVIKN